MKYIHFELFKIFKFYNKLGFDWLKFLNEDLRPDFINNSSINQTFIDENKIIISFAKLIEKFAYETQFNDKVFIVFK